jgi:Flp pilus assembly protein TadG
MRALRHHRDERGTAAVETALVLGILLSLALGAFEWGMALRNWSTVTAASREGARVAAAAGNLADADCLILEAAAGALRNIADDQVVSIRIFRSDTAGAVAASQVYRPSVDTDSPGSLRCSNWFPVSQGYPEANRDNQGAVRHWIGVEVEFDHDWLTDFLWWTGSVCDRGAAPGKDCWTQRTIMYMEPDPTP